MCTPCTKSVKKTNIFTSLKVLHGGDISINRLQFDTEIMPEEVCHKHMQLQLWLPEFYSKLKPRSFLTAGKVYILCCPNLTHFLRLLGLQYASDNVLVGLFSSVWHPLPWHLSNLRLGLHHMTIWRVCPFHAVIVQVCGGGKLNQSLKLFILHKTPWMSLWRYGPKEWVPISIFILWLIVMRLEWSIQILNKKEKGHEAHPAAAHNGLNQHNLQQMHQTLIYRYHYNNFPESFAVANHSVSTVCKQFNYEV